mmetsp:Transcript_5079/g.11525  ORF Transcript_5079/g.11525 Transcript_5079/m.11525 type:complete len:213 (-) Transcript_5079:761-1399(-)
MSGSSQASAGLHLRQMPNSVKTHNTGHPHNFPPELIHSPHGGHTQAVLVMQISSRQRWTQPERNLVNSGSALHIHRLHRPCTAIGCIQRLDLCLDDHVALAACIASIGLVGVGERCRLGGLCDGHHVARELIELAEDQASGGTDRCSDPALPTDLEALEPEQIRQGREEHGSIKGTLGDGDCALHVPIRQKIVADAAVEGARGVCTDVLGPD